MFFRKAFKVKSIVSMLSIFIFPEDGLYNLGIRFTKVDFPHPDIPTKAINSPALISRFIFFITGELLLE